ncbi:hypothetical protein LVJ94_53220 [Pendulispora rubella]|uniref:PorV/PorQ family protein n=1 Tax=Pendulispora rubella TaxID=2741070 RepID=A0ABZ2L4E3_9BACT
MAATAAADPSSTTPQQGYDLGEVQSPRSVAMGGAQNATGTSTTALWLNPANLPYTRVYHFEALATFSPDARRTNFGGAIADSSTSKVSGAFGGVWSQLDPDGARRQWTDLRLALALPLGDQISIGVTGRYLRVNQSVASGPFRDSYVSDGTRGDPLFSQFTFDAGVTVQPVPGLFFGLVGHNLTNPGTALAPTTLAGGVGYMRPQLFTLEANALADFTTWKGTRGRLMFGGEFVVMEHVPLRAGYRYDAGQRAHSVSAGIGYLDKKWSVEISGRRDVATDQPMTLFSIGLKYFVDPKGNNSDSRDDTGMTNSDPYPPP